MRIGVRGHDVGRYNLEDLAFYMEEAGIRNVQLALKKSIIEFKVTKETLTPGLARHIKETFAKHNVNVSLLGCYINMSHPNDEELKN